MADTLENEPVDPAVGARLKSADRNCLSFWYPPIAKAGLPVPQTIIIQRDEGLEALLDGKLPDRWGEFMDALEAAVRKLGPPVFLRTGHGSAKHDWNETCFVDSLDELDRHVGALVEWSALSSIMGLPTRVWAVRKLIETEPIFYAFRGRMPIVREFRFFVRDNRIEHIQPYWPHDAITDPSDENWEELLTLASKLWPHDTSLRELAIEAVEAVGGGYWSVDFLRDRDGKAWLTDMAEGERSFRYESATA
jgi:hypothetical protein